MKKTIFSDYDFSVYMNHTPSSPLLFEKRPPETYTARSNVTGDLIGDSFKTREEAWTACRKYFEEHKA